MDKKGEDEEKINTFTQLIRVADADIVEKTIHDRSSRSVPSIYSCLSWRDVADHRDEERLSPLTSTDPETNERQIVVPTGIPG